MHAQPYYPYTNMYTQPTICSIGKDAHVLGAAECSGLLWLHSVAVLIVAHGF